jgi:hypothetical protein
MEKTKGEMRKYGFTQAAILLALSLFTWWRASPTTSFWREKGIWIFFFSFGLLSLFFAVFSPLLLQWPKRLSIKLGQVLSWLITMLVLLIFYYLIFTPFSLILRLCKKDLLAQNIDAQQNSYWQKKPAAPLEKKSYEHPF